MLELHGWWHVFTGAGAYIFIALVEYLTSEDAGKPLGGRFAWPVGWLVDGEAGKEKVEANGNGHVNGHANGHVKANGAVKANGLNGKANGNGSAKKNL